MQVTKYWLFQEKHPKIIEHENISCLSVDLAVEADEAVETSFVLMETVDAIVHNAGFSQQTFC
jgi:NADP-dependent 3-hydroxy acid dehydrogenase YdfG